ncbi:hypothetical protein Tco_0071818, partial [Tanacetum coccineum]
MQCSTKFLNISLVSLCSLDMLGSSLRALLYEIGESLVLGKSLLSEGSDSVEDENSPEFQDTANSGQKKAMVFYQMDTKEESKRKNMISNEYAVKLCLEHEVKRGNKVVKKELIVALRCEIYFVKFIINPEEDDIKPGVIFGRSFLRLTKAITDLGDRTVTIYPDIDPFLEETEEEGKRKDDWDHLLDFNIDDIPLLGEEGLPPFICKMGKSSCNKKWATKNLNFFYQDIGTSSSVGGHLTQEEAAKEAIAIRISQKFALLEEERPIIKTMAYNDKYKKILDEVWKDKIELDGKIVKEEEEAVKRIKGEALKEKEDPRAFIFHIRLEGQVNENALADTGLDINTMPFRLYVQDDIKKGDIGITMINHTQAKAMGILTNVLCQVGVTTLIGKFLILDIPIDRDSPIVIGRGFLSTIGAIVNTPERLFSTFDGFCHQTFHAARSDFMRNTESDSDDEEEYQIKRNKFGASIYGPKPAPYLNFSFPGSLPVPLKQVNWKPDYKGSYTKEEEATSQWRTKTRLTGPYGNVYLQGFTTKKTDRKLSKYHKMGCDGEIDDRIRIRAREAKSNEEIFTSFDEVCADDELQTKKIIKFRLGRRAHSLTLLEFARGLGLYQAVELEEDGFNVYIEGGLHNDDNFNAQDFWLSISREDNLGLSRSHTSTIRKPILRVIHKMITYGLCQRTTGLGDCEINEEERSWDSERESNLLWDLDTTTLRDLIDSDGKLIPEDPQPGVPRDGDTPRGDRADGVYAVISLGQVPGSVRAHCWGLQCSNVGSLQPTW